jgi:hypothetical protein
MYSISGQLGEFLNVTRDRGLQMLREAAASCDHVSTAAVRDYGKVQEGYDELVAAGGAPIDKLSADVESMSAAEVRMMLQETDRNMIDAAAIADLTNYGLRVAPRLHPALVSAAIFRAVAYVQARQRAEDQDVLSAARWHSTASPWRDGRRLQLGQSGWAVGFQGVVAGDQNLLDPSLTNGTPKFACMLLSERTGEPERRILAQWMPVVAEKMDWSNLQVDELHIDLSNDQPELTLHF